VEGLLAPWHWIIIIGIILLVFGPKKLPELGNSLGKSITGFKKGLREVQDDINTSAAEAERPETVTSSEPVAVQSPVVDGGEAKQSTATPSS
jgi:sec-independent protein translocase protein TatA